MNFFKGKGPDIIEESRELRVKKQLVSEFSVVLKNIQAIQQTRPGEPIYTSDNSNQLCLLFDSLFVHRLKAAQHLYKMEPQLIASQQFGFWSLVKKVTHKGTISQIEKSSHIKTEVGLSRAWVRLAVSDGLMESYLTALFKQPDTLRKYYIRTAFLRDGEYCDILLNLIQVLSHFDFQLVHNTQTLNTWNYKALSFAGFVQSVSRSEQIACTLLPAPEADSPGGTQSERSRSSTLDMDDFPTGIATTHFKPLPSPSNTSLRSTQSARSPSLSVTHLIASESREPGSSGSSPAKLRVQADTLGSVFTDTPDHTKPGNLSWSPDGARAPVNTPLQIRGLLSQRLVSSSQIRDALKEVGGEVIDDKFNGTSTGDKAETVISLSPLPSPKSDPEVALPMPPPDAHRDTAARRELHRLRNANYSLEDVIKPPQPPTVQLVAEVPAAVTPLVTNTALEEVEEIVEAAYGSPGKAESIDIDQQISKELGSAAIPKSTASQPEPRADLKSAYHQDTEKDSHSEYPYDSRNPYETMNPSGIPVEPGNPSEIPVEPGSPSGIPVGPGNPSGIPVKPGNPSEITVEPGNPSGIPVKPGYPSGIPVEPGNPSGIPVKPGNPSGIPVEPGNPSTSRNTYQSGNPFEFVSDEDVIPNEEAVSTAVDVGGDKSEGATFHLGTPHSGAAFSYPNSERELGYLMESDEESEPASHHSDSDSPPTSPDPSEPSSERLPVPLSSARAIMNRRSSAHNAFSYSLPKSTNIAAPPSQASSSSMMRGNSLARLSGWSGSVEPNGAGSLSQSDSKLSHVASLADLVSGKREKEETLTVQPAASVLTVVQPQEPPASGDKDGESEPQDAIDGAEKAESPSDFELIGEDLEKDPDADILKHYGRIMNEKGLDAQNFECPACSRPIGIIYGAPRVCSYTGYSYCTECHCNENSIIPSKAISNWDFSKYRVSKSAKDFLISAESMPLLDVLYLNEKLYQHIPELDSCRILRIQLNYLRRYLFTCSPKIADQLKQKVWPREYLYDEIHTYSVQDLYMLSINPALVDLLKSAVKFARSHVKKCESCEYRGFRCEICRSSEIIFPFDLERTTRCPKCHSVFHSTCLGQQCSKCERLRQRDQLLARSPEGRLDSSVPLNA